MDKSNIETGIDYFADETEMWVTTGEKKWIRKIMLWANTYPNTVKVIKKPEENDGHLYCKMPTSWFNLRPPRHIELTEEQKKAFKERMNTGHSYKDTMK